MMKRKPFVFDQHFLTDQAVRERMLNEADLSANDIVVEIGPGKGILSADIAQRVHRLICIEIDPSMSVFLSALQRTHSNIKVIYANILDMELPHCTKIISNLPFSITEPFVCKLIDCKFEQAVLIVGNRFVSNVVTAQPNHLSLLTNCFLKCEQIAEIPPASFEPKPRVLSSLIRLKKKCIEETDDTVLLLFRFMFLYNQSKVKNALLEAFIKLYATKKMILTKREAKKHISQLTIPDDMLEKQFCLCSNEDLELLYKAIVTNFERDFYLPDDSTATLL